MWLPNSTEGDIASFLEAAEKELENASSGLPRLLQGLDEDTKADPEIIGFATVGTTYCI